MPPQKFLPGTYSRFTLISQRFPIGRGGFGSVWRAVSAELPGVPLAIKFLHNSEFAAAFLNEAQELFNLGNHVRIIQSFGYLDLREFPGWPEAAIVMRSYPVSLQDLLNHLKANRESLDVPLAVSLLRNVAEGLAFLHNECRRVHRDIKPTNILVKLAKDVEYTGRLNCLEGATALIGDLGTAIEIGATEFVHLANDGYKAPELIRPDSGFWQSHPAQDIYSVGCVIRQMIEQIEAPAENLRWLSHECMADPAVLRYSAEDLKNLLISSSEKPGPSARSEFDYPIPIEGGFCARLGAQKLEAEGFLAGPTLRNIGDTLRRTGLTDVQDGAKLTSRYLQALIKRNQELSLCGIQENSPVVPLDSVFVALRGDRTTPYEREQSQVYLEAEILAAIKEHHGELTANEVAEEIEEFQKVRTQILTGLPLMPSLTERDRPEAAPFTVDVDVVNLAEAFYRHRKLVILGDPGHGKTTLLRWLALRLARSFERSDERVMVEARQVDPNAGRDDPRVDLGPKRLPILIRVSEYAKWVGSNKEGEESKFSPVADSSLTDFLGVSQISLLAPAKGEETKLADSMGRLMQEALRSGTAVVMLDGMDEVPDGLLRKTIVEEIGRFIEKWIDRSRGGESAAPGLQRTADESPPGKHGGNQIVITSRVAGYHAAPIRGNITHVMIESMDRPTIEQFCEQWFLAMLRCTSPGRPLDRVTMEATEKAEAFRKAIFDPQCRQVRELAGNPLLLSTLAAVFWRDQRLPEHRADLYQQALENLIYDWRWMRDETGQRARRQELDLATDELIAILAPIAAHIHETNATGLISGFEFHELLLQELARRYPAHKADPKWLSDRQQAIFRAASESVGLLAARGNGIFGFLHLTFQEYLAGLDLLQTPVGAAQRIMEKLPDPRWKEPILLALGRLGSRQTPQLPLGKLLGDDRSKLLLDLLDATDPLGNLIPRVPLLIAGALQEMAVVPAEVVKAVLLKLLRAYADSNRMNDFPQVRGRIEGIFEDLATGRHAAIVAEFLEEQLTRVNECQPTFPAAIAALLHRLDWSFGDSLARALVAALPFDSADFGWPIQACLQAIVTPAIERNSPKPFALPSSRELKELYRTNQAEARARRRRMQYAETANAKRLARFHLQAAHGPVELPKHSLRFREALLANPDLVARIRKDTGWFRVVVALYGGFDDYQSRATLRDYSELSKFLQLPDDERNQRLLRDEKQFAERFGVDDIVYSAAVYLDTGMEGRLSRAKTAPAFRPGAIVRDSPLTPQLLWLLSEDVSSQKLGDRLLRIYSQTDVQEMRVEAAVALVALGKSDLLRRAVPSVMDADLSRAIGCRIDQIVHQLGDPVTRGMRSKFTRKVESENDSEKPTEIQTRWIVEILTSLANCLTPHRWDVVFSAIAHLHNEFADEPFDAGALKNLPIPFLHSPLAEYFVERFACGTVDDVVYEWAVAIDLMRGRPFPIVVAALSRVSETANSRRSSFNAPWHVERLHLHRDEFHSIPLEVIDAVENLQFELFREDLRQVGRGALLDSYRKTFAGEPAPVGLAEMLAVNEFNPDFENRRDFIQCFAPQLSAFGLSPPGEIEKLASDLRTKSAALLRLARNWPELRTRLAEAAIEAAQQLSDCSEKSRLLEACLPLLPRGPKYSKVLESTTSAARMIPDAATRALSIARLYQRHQEPMTNELRRELISAVGEIVDEFERASVIRKLFGEESLAREISTALRPMAASLRDPHSRGHALGLYGNSLLVVEPTVCRLFPEHAEFWNLLTLAGLTRDWISDSSIGETVDSLWRRLPEDPQSVVPALMQQGIANGLRLTRVAAEAIDKCLHASSDDLTDSHSISSLLPLLQDIEQESVAIAEEWLARGGAIARYAALYLAEPNRSVTPRTIGRLIELIAGNEDRGRLRATLILEGSVTVFKRERRIFRAHELKSQVIEALATAALNFDDAEPPKPGPRRVMDLAISAIRFDDPEMWTVWCRRSNEHSGNDPSGRTARFILAAAADFDQQTWLAWKTEFQHPQTTPETRQALFEGLVNLLVRTNEPIGIEAIGDVTWLSKISDDWAQPLFILIRVSNPIVKAIEAAAAEPYTTLEELIDRSTQLLTQAQFSESVASTLHASDSDSDANSKLIESIRRISDNVGWYNDRDYLGNLYDKDRDLRELISDRPEVFGALVLWLVRSFRDQSPSSDRDTTQFLFSNIREWLLFLIGVYCEDSPSTFQNLIRGLQDSDRKCLELGLVNSIRTSNIVGRIAAVRILGKFRQLGFSAVLNLLDALIDEAEVRLMAESVVGNLPNVVIYRNLATELAIQDVQVLADFLRHESASVARAAARILESVARNQGTTAEIRDAVVNSLVSAIDDPQIRSRGVYEIAGNGQKEESGRHLAFVGPLRSFLLDAVLAIAGEV